MPIPEDYYGVRSDHMQHAVATVRTTASFTTSAAWMHDIEFVLNRLRLWVDMAGSQKEAARRAGVSAQFLCDVLKRRREPTDKLLAQIGLKRMVIYVPAE